MRTYHLKRSVLGFVTRTIRDDEGWLVTLPSTYPGQAEANKRADDAGFQFIASADLLAACKDVVASAVKIFPEFEVKT